MTPIKLQSIAEDLLMQSSVTRVIVVGFASGGSCSVLAEAVTHDADQLRHSSLVPTLVSATAIESLSQTGSRFVIYDVLPTGYNALAQALSPIHVNGMLRGVVVLQDRRKYWSQTDGGLAAIAGLAAATELEQQDRQALACQLEHLRNAAIQSILDQLRAQMGVQRCTFRQDVSTHVAFPVTHESRTPETRSLIGDLTIVLNGQPVIEQMTRLRTQVVQNDTSTASAEPDFHRMLRHYGNLRSQIVTPLIKDSRLVGAVSVHDLGRAREWSSDERALAEDASRLLGLVAGVGQG